MKLVATFEIKGLPKVINAIGRKHWIFKHNETKLWKSLVHLKCRELGIDYLNLENAKLEFTRFSSRQLDFDSLVNSFKHVQDGLVEAGVLIDDSPNVIGQPSFKWEKCKQKEGKIGISIWTVPKDAI